MKTRSWQARFAGRAPEPQLRSWLTEPGSLTARCRRACADFRVRLLHQQKDRPLPAEGRERRLQWVREVVLECDGVPVIFAHTTLSTVPRGRLGAWLKGLGERSLGSLLFTDPRFRRDPIEYRRLDHRDPLFRRARSLGVGGPVLWARRSLHHLGRQQVLVTEVFLPAITRLG